MIEFECMYGGEPHTFPDDWVFGGPDMSHPGADPRWEVTHYQYLDAEYGFCYMTGSFLCDDEALDMFTVVAQRNDPVYIAKKKQGDNKFTLMPFEYRKAEDTVYPREWNVIVRISE